MGIFELFALAVGLSMDAFAVSICKGIGMGSARSLKSACIVGAWFGVFQAIMPIIGYFLGVSFHSKIESIDHWVAFILLLVIGLEMIREGLGRKEDDSSPDIGFAVMFFLALATSIDALATGIAISAAGGGIVLGALFIGFVTFTISAFGVSAGSALGKGFGHKAKIVGGIVLAAIGFKILIEHLFF